MDAVYRRHETVVSEPAWAVGLMWVGLPLAGAGAGWLLQALAGWLAELPWVPFDGIVEWIASVADNEPLATIVSLAAGAVVGLVLAVIGAMETLVVRITDSEVTLRRGDTKQKINRARVRTVFIDRKQLVLLGVEADELAREGFDLGADRLRDGFIAHGYPWSAAGDPYRDEFRRWVPDDPELPGSAGALLKARSKALEDGNKTDIAELRAELAKLGVVVREEAKRQYWRRTHPTSG
ncbi:YqeB family protein [Phytohabitans sp. LJ34]|uniref:YqeB family protein n=1 Tax=Phytohabitans sp. LJ34 TaxID=3452217 RepID=UPI003F8B4150